MYFLTLSLLAIVSGSIAWCPESQKVNILNGHIEKLIGVNYEYKKSPNFWSRGKCVSYTPQPHNSTYMTLSMNTIIEDNKNIHKEIGIDLDETNYVLHLTSQNANMNNLGVTKDYAFFASCEDKKINQFVVTTKVQNPSKDVIKEIDQAIQKLGNVPDLVLTDQRC